MAPLAAFSQAPSATVDPVFESKDWVLGCDNTGQCRAVGYQAEHEEEDDGRAVAFTLVRNAGAGAPLSAEFQLRPGPASTQPLRVLIDDQDALVALRPHAPIDAAALRALLPRMLDASELAFAAGEQRWTLSLAGLKATLLKMDAAQGRVDTAEALVHPGAKPTGQVPPPRPAPRVAVARWPATRATDALLGTAVLSGLKRDCDPPRPGQAPLAHSVRRVSASQVLVFAECSRGSRQSTYEVYLANDRPPYHAQMMLFPVADDTSNADVLSPQLGDSAVTEVEDTPEGDCGDRWHWYWTERGFVLGEHEQAPLCRHLKLGGYPLRLWTTQAATEAQPR